jgi:two-component system phosphate regulon response regulator OmpR
MNQTSARTDTIVVVDDDARISDLLRRYLTQEGFDVMVAEDSQALDRILLRETVDLIVLDLMLPGEDGLSVCRRLRAANNRTPIIMLTAKSEDVDRIVGLEVGADDYLGKPFNPRELLARMHAVLRRRPPMEAPGAPSTDSEIVNFGPFSFNLSSRALKKDGVELSLTTGEFAMLKALVRHPRQPLSREKLAQLARGRDFEPFDRSLDVQVSRLRKLIETDAAAPRYIQTVWMKRGAEASDSISLRRREICTSRLRSKGSNSRPRANWASFSRDSGWRGCRTSALSIANSPVVSDSSSPSFLSVREPRSKLNGPKFTVSFSVDGAPGASSGGRRRSTACTRASSSRGLKGLPR